MEEEILICAYNKCNNLFIKTKKGVKFCDECRGSKLVSRAYGRQIINEFNNNFKNFQIMNNSGYLRYRIKIPYFSVAGKILEVIDFNSIELYLNECKSLIEREIEILKKLKRWK